VRICLDATSLLLPSAGVRNYLHYWLLSLELAAAARGDGLTTYPPGITSGRLDHTLSGADPLATRWRMALVQFANIRFNPALTLLQARTDVFHCSQHCAAPPRWTASTATVFDMSCWRTPQYHTPANIAATRRYADRVLQRCSGIIAISEHARQDAMDILRLPGERFRVVYPGVAGAFFQTGAAEASAVRARHALHAPYALFVGCIEPRKNVGGLLRAWQSLPAPVRRDHELVVAGPFGWESSAMRQALERGTPGVRYIGYVPEEDLPGLFAGAQAFVYPSFYEGFGLPVAQALAAGIPVITSNGSALPEVTGGAAICVDPDRPEELAQAMEAVLSRPELAADLKLRGHVQAQRFQWKCSAEESLDFFHSIAGRQAV
jgi:alpha-1,3-rhamnosyl/mannosyltransferase